MDSLPDAIAGTLNYSNTQNMQAIINAEAGRQNNPLMPDPSSMCSDIGCEQMNQYMLAIISLPQDVVLVDSGAGLAEVGVNAGRICLFNASKAAGPLARAGFLGGSLFTANLDAGQITIEPIVDVVQQYEQLQDIAVEASLEGEAQSLNPSHISPTLPPKP
jgi:hypothetical protein